MLIKSSSISFFLYFILKNAHWIAFTFTFHGNQITSLVSESVLKNFNGWKLNHNLKRELICIYIARESIQFHLFQLHSFEFFFPISLLLVRIWALNNAVKISRWKVEKVYCIFISLCMHGENSFGEWKIYCLFVVCNFKLRMALISLFSKNRNFFALIPSSDMAHIQIYRTYDILFHYLCTHNTHIGTFNHTIDLIFIQKKAVKSLSLN